MNLSRRSLLWTGGGLAAAASLAACGAGSPTVGTSATPTASPAAEVAAGQAAVGKLAASAPLRHWYHEYGEEGVLAAVERYAAAYPGGEVSVRWTPGDYDSVLSAQLLTNEAPDVFEVEQGGTLDMIRSGQLADLTDLIGDRAAEFNPSVMQRFTFEGRIYGIPQTIDTQVLYYRPSLLETAGVAPPATFGQLVSAATAVTAATGVGGFFAGNDGGVGALGPLLIWASGCDQLTADRSAVAFLGEPFYAALRAYRDFLHSGAVVRTATGDWHQGTALANGEAAMQWGGLWSLPEMQTAWGDDVAVLPFPAIGTTGRPAVPFGAFGACVAANGTNVEVAKDYIRWLWMDREDYQLDFSDSYGTHIPAKPSLEGAATKLTAGPGRTAARCVSDHGFASDIMWSGALGDAYGTALAAVLLDGAEPAPAFAEFQAVASIELALLKG